MTTLFPQTKFNFSINGQDILVQKMYGGRNSPPILVVTVKGQFAGRLQIRRENFWDRFTKNIGLDREPQVPDREANDKLYFECDDQDLVNRIFMSGDLKSQIMELINVGFSINIQPQKCIFRKIIGDEEFNEKTCEDLAKKFSAFTLAIPPSSGSGGNDLRFQLIKIIILATGYTTLAAGLYAFWLGFAYSVVESSQCWSYAGRYIIPAILAAGLLSFVIVRGFATSSKVYTHFISVFCLGAVMAGYFGTQYINGENDHGDPSSFIQNVISKYTSTSKNSTTYHVLLAPWRGNGSAFHFTVGSSEYASITTGVTTYTVTTKPGILGLEWLVSNTRNADPQTASTEFAWPPRDYTNWYPLHSDNTIDREEMAYWEKWVRVIEQGITNRMNAHDQINNTQRVERATQIKNEYWRRQTKLLEVLAQVQPPERLKEFHQTVLDAGRDQIEFYKDFGAAKEDNAQIKFENVSGNAHLKDSDQKLWAAYHQFQALYPNRSKDFNDSVERRLAWFDII